MTQILPPCPVWILIWPHIPPHSSHHFPRYNKGSQMVAVRERRGSSWQGMLRKIWKYDQHRMILISRGRWWCAVMMRHSWVSPVLAGKGNQRQADWFIIFTPSLPSHCHWWADIVASLTDTGLITTRANIIIQWWRQRELQYIQPTLPDPTQAWPPFSSNPNQSQ